MVLKKNIAILNSADNDSIMQECIINFIIINNSGLNTILYKLNYDS